MKEEKNFENETSTADTQATKVVKDIPSVRLSPEQIEDINADDYSLMLFNATRVQPLSLSELKRFFVEPSSKKAESVMERFLKLGLIHKTEDGKFFSNFPENYINYSDYRYDGDLETKKDAKVFQLMKEFTGQKEYWKDKTYFSIDAFFTDDQSKELNEMFKAIKLKAKQFSNENENLGVKGIKFRRLKFYDMFWVFAIFVLTFTMTVIQPSSSAYAKIGGSGNDPVGMVYIPGGEQLDSVRSGGSGNDPTASIRTLYIEDNQGGGGGHDPESTQIPCEIKLGTKILKGIFNEQSASCELMYESVNLED
ncbi:hypothetical protein DOM21_13200 [Bacteriovorax stolpii]|uniref:hypothetical protein n=1 Tax=Bacteriovorax stolpii TaxID=960 RepID=UPI00115704FE|nr:hypothetical protein [Bacteriovorax stolpii]QDK42383.1 hypothetical protein DOM21_13200 [Bacteriovorax stolpii]